MCLMSDSNYIQFSVLRVPERDVLGASTPLKAASFQSSNAPGKVREVQDYKEVRQLGANAATRLTNAFGSTR